MKPTTMRIVAGFEEPFVATGSVSDDEDAAFQAAIDTYCVRPEPDGFAGFEQFMVEFPDSAWCTAILTNLGFGYYHRGYFSRALAAWQLAWRAGRDVSDPRAKAMTDRALGELFRMHARLGHAAELSALIAELGDRPVSPGAKEAVAGAGRGLWVMENEPGIAFLCGPLALRALLRAEGLSEDLAEVLNGYRSSPGGVSLAELGRLADEAGLRNVAVRREPGGEIPVPSIIHWTVNHYAAVVGEEAGYFHIEDPTFGGDLWVTRDAIDAESSGYFLCRAGEAAPGGSRPVSEEESASVYGMGMVADGDPKRTTPQDPKTKPYDSGCGMPVYNFHETLASLNLTDTPVGYTPARGPAVFVTLTYNQREATQPANFSFGNVGAQWSLSWLTYIVDDPAVPGGRVTRHVGGGGAVDYRPSNPFDGTFVRERADASQLVRLASGPDDITYERHLSDGSVEEYSTSDHATVFPRKVFLRRVTDPAGNSVSLTYDARLRLTSITDALGRDTVFSYNAPIDPLLISKITDPFGRSAELTYHTGYTIDHGYVYPHPSSVWTVTDVMDMTTEFDYYQAARESTGDLTYSSGLLSKMATPYGSTAFSYFENPDNLRRYVEATDTLGHKERLEFRDHAPGIAASSVIRPNPDPQHPVPLIYNQFDEYRNTFYWDKHAYPEGLANPAAPDYSKARINHYYHDALNVSTMSEFLESVKNPLEDRVRYGYGLASLFMDGLNRPTWVARQLADGRWQTLSVAYNAVGRPTRVTDPVGRQTQFTYAANEIDLTAIEQKTSPAAFTPLMQLAYSSHRPDAYTSAVDAGAAFEYDAFGLVAAIRTPLRGHMVETSYVRDHLDRITDVFVNELDVVTAAVINTQKVVHAGYDAFDRVAFLETEPSHKEYRPDGHGHLIQTGFFTGDRISFEYDALDRIVGLVYPDGTRRTRTWDKLDLVAETDRDGSATWYEYDSERHLVSETDALGLTTGYQVFQNGVLQRMTDPAGNATTWDIDLQSRVTAQHFADNTSVAFAYDAVTGWLATATDGLGQTRTYAYHLDGRLASITYGNAAHPTPTVTFDYDAYFPRLASMTDGVGTTVRSYNPPSYSGLDFAGGGLRLASEVGPFGLAASDSAHVQYDEQGRLVQLAAGFYSLLGPSTYDWLGRITENRTPFGSFAQEYLRGTDQITVRHSGVIRTQHTYDTNEHDRRLTSIATTNGRFFSYQSSPEGHVESLTESGTGPEKNWIYSYDAAGRLTNAEILQVLTPSGPGPAFPNDRYAYTYDKAGNITSMKQGSSPPITATYNSVNEIVEFDGIPFRYDANGNLVEDFRGTYQWDAENRLIRIDYKLRRPEGDQGETITLPGDTNVPPRPGGLVRSTVFTYDGLGRRVAITEIIGNNQTETRLIWCGDRLVGTTSFVGGTSATTRDYFPEGQANIAGGGTAYSYLYYGRDHIASVRDVVLSPSGTNAASIDYDPYGNVTNASADISGVDFTYAGMFLHQPSGLYLTRFRVYDPKSARWLSRDPIGRWSGANPYAYAGNDPVNNRDALGLQTELPPPPGQSPPTSGMLKNIMSGGVAPAVDALVDAYKTYKKGKAAIDKVDEVANQVLDLKDDWNSPELIDQLDFISDWVHLIPNMPSSVEKVIREALKTAREAPGGGQAAARQHDYGSENVNDARQLLECDR